MTRLDAFHLPGLTPEDVEGWERRPLGDDLELRWPRLRPEGLRRVLERLRTAGDGLRARPVSDIVGAMDAAASRLADPTDPLRAAAEQALPRVTGFSPPMVRLVLDRMTADWREPALRDLLRVELGDPQLLDGFRPDPSASALRRVRALGPELAFHVFAGNVPGVAVTSLVRTLLVKAPALGKTASGEPVLAPLFARALAEADPELGGALAVTYWPGGSETLEEVALALSDTVVAYGGGEAEASLRRRTKPGSCFLSHGPRYSFGVVGRDALRASDAPAAAAVVARAVAAFDQQGCVSPHMVYVETGAETSPEAFAGLIAGELSTLERTLPRGILAPAESAAIHTARAEAEFREIAGAPVRLHAGPGTAYTVVYDADPAFTTSCLNRFLWVKPLDDVTAAATLVRPYAEWLQTVAVAGLGDRLAALAEALARAGASRITTFDAAPWPPPAWHHDGRGPLRELLRWIDLEG